MDIPLIHYIEPHMYPTYNKLVRGQIDKKKSKNKKSSEKEN